MVRACLIVVAMCLPMSAFAQEASMPIDFLRPGSEVRVWSRDPRLSGWRLEYVGRTDTTILLAERSGSKLVGGFSGVIPVSAIDRVEVRTGTIHEPGRE